MFKCLTLTYLWKKEKTIPSRACHAASRQEVLFKNPNEDIYEKCN